jgi:hypothetical protein
VGTRDADTLTADDTTDIDVIYGDEGSDEISRTCEIRNPGQ